MEASPLLITWVAQTTAVNAVMASTTCAIRVRPCGVGAKKIANPTAIDMNNGIHLIFGELAAAGAGGAATGRVMLGVLIDILSRSSQFIAKQALPAAPSQTTALYAYSISAIKHREASRTGERRRSPCAAGSF